MTAIYFLYSIAVELIVWLFLVPFEAADHGVPCLWAQGTSLSEVLPDEAAGITPWDAEPSADRVASFPYRFESPQCSYSPESLRKAAR